MIFCHAIRVGFKHKMSRKFPLGYGYITEVIFYVIVFKEVALYRQSVHIQACSENTSLCHCVNFEHGYSIYCNFMADADENKM